MIINKATAEAIFEIMDDNKRISRMTIEKSKFVDWCHTINAINALTEKKTVLNGNMLAEYEIVTSLADLIVPQKVAFRDNYNYVDFRSPQYDKYMSDLKSHGMEGATVLEPFEFSKLSGTICAIRRVNVVLSKCNDIRGTKTISDLEHKSGLVIDKKVYCESGMDSVVPVVLTISFVLPEFHSEDADRVLLKWFLKTYQSMM